jgi:CelD/BcsL family acetyltransferase involved in cellulose biosynthesis
LKRGCTLQAERDPQALAAWYPLYRQQAAAWAQAPLPLALLQALVVEPGDHGLFNTVRLDGEIIAGHVCFRSRGRLVAWQGAARPDLQRSHFPTTLVYWQGIREACARGLEAVDFGGSVGRDSLWDFKRRCGAEAESRWQLLARSTMGRLLDGVRARRRGGAR